MPSIFNKSRSKMNPRKIKKRLDRLFDMLCKKSVEKDNSSIGLRYVDVEKFHWDNRDGWIGKTYGLEGWKIAGPPNDENAVKTNQMIFKAYHFSLEEDLKALNELDLIEFTDDKSIRISIEQIMENGRSWCGKMFEKQPATTISLIISLIALIFALLSFYNKGN